MTIELHNVGKVFCPECYEWKDEINLVKTEDGFRRMCGSCNFKYCNCGKYLESPEEKTAGECHKCMGDR